MTLRGGWTGVSLRGGWTRRERVGRKGGGGTKNVQGRNEMWREEERRGGGRNAIFPFGAFSSDRGTTCARLSDF